MRILFIVLTFILVVSAITSAKGADTNTVSSTVVTNNTPPTANAPRKADELAQHSQHHTAFFLKVGGKLNSYSFYPLEKGIVIMRASGVDDGGV